MRVIRRSTCLIVLMLADGLCGSAFTARAANEFPFVRAIPEDVGMDAAKLELARTYTLGWCRQAHRPGTTWMYSEGRPNWLADCLTVAYGRDPPDVMNQRVFEPSGISVGDTRHGGEHDPHWGFNHLGRPQQVGSLNRRPFGAGIHCNVRAMAKIGIYSARSRDRPDEMRDSSLAIASRGFIRTHVVFVGRIAVNTEEEESVAGENQDLCARPR